MSANDYLKLVDFLWPLVDKYGVKEVKSQVVQVLRTMKDNDHDRQ